MLSNRKGAARISVVLLSTAAVVGSSLVLGAGPASATVAAPVTVTSLGATKGSTLGGTNVLISGRGFLNVDDTVTTSVKFGATDATSYLVLSDTQIAAKAPVGTGTVDVKVTDTNANFNAVTLSDKFTYLAPITTTVPASTLLNSMGGSIITVTASVYTWTDLATFTAEKITATVGGATATVKYKTGATVDVTVPAGTPSNTPTKVMLYHNTVAGTGDSTNAKYAAVISKLSVTTGPVAGGGTIALTGKGFLAGGTFKLGTVALTGCTIVTDVSVTTCTIPAAAAAAAGAVSANFVPTASVPFGTTVGATYSYTNVS